MRVRMFKPRFAPLVKSGAKRQTIRPLPKRVPNIGDLESWRQWSGLPYRSPQVELAEVRITMLEVFALLNAADFGLVGDPMREAWLGINSWNAFARADGFGSMEELVKWFEAEHDLPFIGLVITAEDL